jgi:hypothetical protein
MVTFTGRAFLVGQPPPVNQWHLPLHYDIEVISRFAGTRRGAREYLAARRGAHGNPRAGYRCRHAQRLLKIQRARRVGFRGGERGRSDSKNGSVIQSGRIAFGGVAPTPWQDAGINQKLSGLAISGDSFAQLSESSFTDAQALAMNAYKVPLVRNLMKRLLTQLTA